MSTHWSDYSLRGWLSFLAFMHIGMSMRSFFDSTFLYGRIFSVNTAAIKGTFCFTNTSQVSQHWALLRVFMFDECCNGKQAMNAFIACLLINRRLCRFDRAHSGAILRRLLAKSSVHSSASGNSPVLGTVSDWLATLIIGNRSLHKESLLMLPSHRLCYLLS